jgi:hypothetical protein
MTLGWLRTFARLKGSRSGSSTTTLTSTRLGVGADSTSAAR